MSEPFPTAHSHLFSSLVNRLKTSSPRLLLSWLVLVAWLILIVYASCLKRRAWSQNKLWIFEMEASVRVQNVPPLQAWTTAILPIAFPLLPSEKFPRQLFEVVRHVFFRKVNHRARAHLRPSRMPATPWRFSSPAEKATARPHSGLSLACETRGLLRKIYIGT